jgi:hypothetical protein
VKTYATLILLTVSLLGWTSAHAEFDPDSYLYGKVGFGYNATNDWSDNHSEGSNLGMGYVVRLTDWNLFGSLRYEYFNGTASRVIHSDEDNYLSHWGISTEWRFGIFEKPTPDDYFYTNLFFGPNNGPDWEDSGTLGSGFGVGYTRLLVKKLNIFGTIRYEHYSQLMAGEPFASDKEETHLDHIGILAEWRFSI